MASNTTASTLPLRLPDAPFDLAQAQRAAVLLRWAYILTRAWEADNKPAPESFSWAPTQAIEGLELGAPLWASARGWKPFHNHQPFGFIAREGELGYLVFRGTETPQDFGTNLRLDQIEYPFVSGFGHVHDGFAGLYAALREPVLAELERLGLRSLIVAGHSMGAGVSSLAFCDLATNVEALGGRVLHYCFGSPRVGNPEFAAAANALANPDGGWGVSYRLNNSADPVAHLPPMLRDKLLGEDVLYQHFGVGIELSANYGSIGVNHSVSRTYLYAIEHPEQPHNPDAT
ncbi:Lipase (class 3) [Enhygromyxa salina]|uniref:Lipase (Class 3) n=1 Tax=Enhygromyxa salina TaxID=215803 RepID=A0A2S9XXN2_9BACT|nr:lipase family protein [Enhygromyxa salina]PRP97616.1 Lipase (class 3) [Enhygromyxa salina]